MGRYFLLNKASLTYGNKIPHFDCLSAEISKIRLYPVFCRVYVFLRQKKQAEGECKHLTSVAGSFLHCIRLDRLLCFYFYFFFPQGLLKE